MTLSGIDTLKMVIGIGGISNSGKSRLAGRLKNYYSDKKVSVLCQDDYVFPKAKIPTVRDHIDWECPESIDFVRFEQAVISSLITHDIVIVEGIFAFHHESTNLLMNKKIFLTLDARFFFMRKNNDIRWGKEPDWYVEHIWESHNKYCKENIPDEALVLAADKEIDLNMLVSFLNSPC